jgi:hypothetical protein
VSRDELGAALLEEDVDVFATVDLDDALQLVPAELPELDGGFHGATLTHAQDFETSDTTRRMGGTEPSPSAKNGSSGRPTSARSNLDAARRRGAAVSVLVGSVARREDEPVLEELACQDSDGGSGDDHHGCDGDEQPRTTRTGSDLLGFGGYLCQHLAPRFDQ